MLIVRWQGVTERGHSKMGEPMVETWSTTKDVSIDFGATFLIIKTVIGGQLLLSVPSWRIIDVTTE